MGKRLKKGSIKWHKKRCDIELSKLVREKGRCEWCSRTDGQLHCSHVIPRTNLALRYDILNVKALCGYCHRFRWHENPLEAMDWFSNRFPQRYDYLMENKTKIIKRTPEDYKILLKKIKNKDLKGLVTFSP